MPSAGDHRSGQAIEGAPPARAPSPPRTPGLRLAAIVPATDAPASLDRCLASLGRSQPPPDEVVVVCEPRRSGPSAARNAGAARSRADVLVFVDSDVEVHRDALGRIATALEQDPGLDAVFGAYDDEPTDAGLVSRYRNLLHHHVHTSAAGPAATFWAGLGAVRREAFVGAGGFDARRFPAPAVEDIELGMRLAAAGHRIRLDPEIRGRHLKAWRLAEVVRTDFARRAVPWTRLQLEAARPSRELNMTLRRRLGALASALAVGCALRRRPARAAAALAALLALERRFYALLARRGGAALAVVGVAMHVLHHLTAIAALPVALVAHLRERPR